LVYETKGRRFESSPAHSAHKARTLAYRINGRQIGKGPVDLVQSLPGGELFGQVNVVGAVEKLLELESIGQGECKVGVCSVPPT
jgi:hypothetical protein